MLPVREFDDARVDAKADSEDFSASVYEVRSIEVRNDAKDFFPDCRSCVFTDSSRAYASCPLWLAYNGGKRCRASLD